MLTVSLSCFRPWGRFPLDLFPSVPLNHRRTGGAVYSETLSHRLVLTRSSVGLSDEPVSSAGWEEMRTAIMQ